MLGVGLHEIGQDRLLNYAGVKWIDRQRARQWGRGAAYAEQATQVIADVLHLFLGQHFRGVGAQQCLLIMHGIGFVDLEASAQQASDQRVRAVAWQRLRAKYAFGKQAALGKALAKLIDEACLARAVAAGHRDHAAFAAFADQPRGIHRSLELRLAPDHMHPR